MIQPTVRFKQGFDISRQNHFWFGGLVAEVEFNKDFFIKIEALGDVRVREYSLTRHKKRILQQEFVDKNNSGEFYSQFYTEFNSDAELAHAIEGQYNKLLEVDNNNWWEAIPVIYGEEFDFMMVLDSSNLLDAIVETIESFANFNYESFAH